MEEKDLKQQLDEALKEVDPELSETMERRLINVENVMHMHDQLNRLDNQLDELVKAMYADPDMGDIDKVKDLDPKILEIVKNLKKSMFDMGLRLDVLENIAVKLDMLDEMDEEIHEMRRILDKFKDVDFMAMYRNILEQMNVEAIKIYRNLQAVIVEEDAKQNHVLVGVDGKSDKLKGRMNHVMIFSIVSFVVSILVMLITILPQFGIKLF